MNKFVYVLIKGIDNFNKEEKLIAIFDSLNKAKEHINKYYSKKYNMIILKFKLNDALYIEIIE